jgi:hypothetical protein
MAKVISNMTIPFISLKRGLQTLQDQDQAQKSQIEADLKANKLLTQSDEKWLDGEGNLVDKEHVVQELKNASDYEWALQELNIKNQSIVERLQVLRLKEAKPHMFAIIFFPFSKLTEPSNRSRESESGQF